MVIDDAWLDGANPADLEALARSLLDGRVGDRFSMGAVLHAGFDEHAGAFVESLKGTDPAVTAWMLQRLAQERRKADDRYASIARLAWSGASAGEQAIRDTRVLLDGLFGRAERHVLIATYVIYDGRSVFASLSDRLRARPEIQVDLYVNLLPDPDRSNDEEADVRDFLTTFARDNWATDVPPPAIYYDPETRRLGPKRAALHAKCVVVDERWAFVTSANFTEAAQERNIEVGVLLDHPKLAGALAGRFHALREDGVLKRMR